MSVFFVIAFRFAQGLISGLLIPSVIALIPAWCSPQERGTLMSIAIVGMPLANVVSSPVAGALCASHMDGGWPMIFYLPGRGHAYPCMEGVCGS